ncbi:MAG: GNAT family N-acetyltransferase [Pseudomonadota bacterium]
MSDISTRPLGEDDYEAWLPLWNGYCDFYSTNLRDGVSRSTFERMVDPDNQSMFGFLGLDANDTPVGMVTAVLHPSTFTLGPRCYLEDLFTHADARGKGVGRALIEAVADLAKDHGCDQLYWHTDETNYAGRMLYDKLATKSHLKYSRKL